MKLISKIATLSVFAFLCAANIFSQTRPVSNSITAKSGTNKTIEIQIDFPANTEPKITGIKLYRASKPIMSYKEIEALKPIAVLSEPKYSDAVPTAGEYFYAAVAVTPLGDYKTIIPGMNSTLKGVRAMVSASSLQSTAKAPSQNDTVQDTEPVYIDTSKTEKTESRSQLPALTNSSNPTIRNMPLPLPSTILGLNQDAIEVSDEALQSVQGLAGGQEQKAQPFKVPYFFEEDMFAPDGGDEYILFETLRAGLVQRKYEQSVSLLSDFLSINRTKAATNRAEFYLGESFYFCGDYQNAIRCFLSVQDIFPELSKKWLDSSIDLLEIDF